MNEWRSRRTAPRRPAHHRRNCFADACRCGARRNGGRGRPGGDVSAVADLGTPAEDLRVRRRYGTEALEPATALALRARIERYAERTRRDRAAVVCTSALRPVLAEFLLRSGIRVSVYAYGELPNELALAPAEVIEGEEQNALAR